MSNPNQQSPANQFTVPNGRTETKALHIGPQADRGQAPTAVPIGSEPLLIDIKELCRKLGRSKASIERDIELGRIPAPLRLGNSRKWRLAEINAWVEAGMPDRETWERIYKKNGRR
jgi:predicted DNA-binding transcriptional regulator AlpA